MQRSPVPVPEEAVFSGTVGVGKGPGSSHPQVHVLVTRNILLASRTKCTIGEPVCLPIGCYGIADFKPNTSASGSMFGKFNIALLFVQSPEVRVHEGVFISLRPPPGTLASSSSSSSSKNTESAITMHLDPYIHCLETLPRDGGRIDVFPGSMLDTPAARSTYTSKNGATRILFGSLMTAPDILKHSPVPLLSVPVPVPVPLLSPSL